MKLFADFGNFRVRNGLKNHSLQSGIGLPHPYFLSKTLEAQALIDQNQSKLASQKSRLIREVQDCCNVTAYSFILT